MTHMTLNKFLDGLGKLIIWASLLGFVGAISYGIWREIGIEGTLMLAGITVYAFAISWAIHRQYN